MIMAMMVNDSNLGDEGEEDSDSDWFGNLCAVDSKVAGAVEDEGDFGDYRGGGDNGNGDGYPWIMVHCSLRMDRLPLTMDQ